VVWVFWVFWLPMGGFWVVLGGSLGGSVVALF